VAQKKLIKVCLTNQGEDTETPWAEDLGPAPRGPKGSRRVRLANVPFLHARPTWGDIIIVSPVEDGVLTWDRDGASWKKVPSLILETGGHWAMIVDYQPHSDTSGIAAYRALEDACVEHDIVCEGAWAPAKGEPGRAYFAVPASLDDRTVMTALRAASLPCELIQIHPKPVAKKKPAAKKPAKRKRSG
jgi:hypothetical protein